MYEQAKRGGGVRRRQLAAVLDSRESLDCIPSEFYAARPDCAPQSSSAVSIALAALFFVSVLVFVLQF